MTTVNLKAIHLQEPYLNVLRKERIVVSIYLINGIKLVGVVASFDQYVIILKDNNSSISQLLYKHAISTISPSRAFDFSTTDNEI